jgi:hypothetical protein
MFESLADRIREDEHSAVKTSERLVRWVVVAIVSVLLFGGLYIGIRVLEG